jgi:hypothetical protein
MVVTSLWVSSNSTSDVTTIHYGQPLHTIHFTIQSIYVIPMTANCNIELLMMGTAGIRKMYRSWNKTNIIQLHLIGYSYTCLVHDAWNHQHKTKLCIGLFVSLLVIIHRICNMIFVVTCYRATDMSYVYPKLLDSLTFWLFSVLLIVTCLVPDCAFTVLKRHTSAASAKLRKVWDTFQVVNKYMHLLMRDQ